MPGKSIKEAFSSLATTTEPTGYPTVAQFRFQMEPDGLVILWYAAAYSGWSGRCISPRILTSAPTMNAIVTNELAIVVGTTTEYYYAPSSGSNYWVNMTPGGAYP